MQFGTILVKESVPAYIEISSHGYISTGNLVHWLLLSAVYTVAYLNASLLLGHGQTQD